MNVSREFLIVPSQFHLFMQLPEHIQVKILDNCQNVRTMLNLTETCRQMHQLFLSSPHLMRRIKLVIKFTRNSDDAVDKLSTLLTNASIGRRYSKLKLIYANEGLLCYSKSLMIKILKIVGGSVKELEVSLGHYNVTNLQEVLRCFDVEKVTLSNLQVDIDSPSDYHDILPNLKELLLIDSSSSVLQLFRNFTTLRRFKFHLQPRESESFSCGVEKFENFILQQRALKFLEFSRLHRLCLFRDNSLDEIKFQLDSISANRFFLHKNNAINFFSMQKNLHTVKLFDFYDLRIFSDPTEYSKVLRAIFLLPKLKTVGIYNRTVNVEDFSYLCDIRNKSVKHLEYDMWNSIVLSKLVEIFPRLKNISFRCFTLKLKNVPCDKLAIINTSGGYKLEEFNYQPMNFCMLNGKFPQILSNFIQRHKSIKHLTIGQSSWIESNFGLDLNFWIEVLFYLSDLCTLVIYNPLHIKLLIMLIARNKNVLNSVTLYTNEFGRKESQDRKFSNHIKMYKITRIVLSNFRRIGFYKNQIEFQSKLPLIKAPVKILLSASGIALFESKNDYKEKKIEDEKESELIMAIKRGVLAVQREEYKKAEQLFHVALRMAQTLKNQLAVTYIFDLMGNLAYESNELDKAEKLFVDVIQRLMQLEKAAEDDIRLLHISTKLAHISYLKNNLEKAMIGYEYVLERIEKKDYLSDENLHELWGMCKNFIGQAFISLKQHQKAQKALNDAMKKLIEKAKAACKGAWMNAVKYKNKESIQGAEKCLEQVKNAVV
ncbi:CLUMA_CG015184, isoform A [Clunio marinus]|uniref:CLUMA_CG015184, isoform A n=1 Tax=Clunio marinus TaxID=568069 RepID=A0A1J1IQJ6_9DIPT|nr:CLUMA_CG015184, isoform A [Clunio marinus]